MRALNEGLVGHAGCRGCGKECLHNGPVATKEVADRTKRMLFACNDRKGIPKHKEKTWIGKIVSKFRS